MEIILGLLIGFWILRFFANLIISFVIWLYDSILGGFSPDTERRIRYAVSQIIRWLRFGLAIWIIVSIFDMFF